MARPVTITLSHDLGRDEARRRVREGFDKLKGAMTGGMMFNVSEEWTSDDTLQFTGKGLGQSPANRAFSRTRKSIAASVEARTVRRLSCHRFCPSPIIRPVAGMNCHRPAAPSGE